jgi:hypothetical protein
MSLITFAQVRAARRVLNMKRAVAASLLGMPVALLSKGEQFGGAVPVAHVTPALELLKLARRVRRGLAGPPGNRRFPRENLPFPRPRCACGRPLHVAGTNYSPRRGEFWYFLCPACGRRYWSSDGRARPVQPKGGAWRLLKDRVRCPSCEVECRAVAPRSSRSRSRAWLCPRCRTRYLNVRGRAVPCAPENRGFLSLPFLASRECPACGNGRLSIRARPHPPKTRHFYFRCGACRATFRFEKRLERLVPLRVRSHARAIEAG